MANIENNLIRAQLRERRRRLDDAMAASPSPEKLVGLLRQVDQALERLDRGTYGMCETCHDAIEPDRLLANPLECFCLDHLTERQQRALEKDLEMASLIQGRLLPPPRLAMPPWELAHLSIPAGPVSGDYCDVVAPEESGGTVSFLVGDVSGKGVAASLLMAQLQAIFRSLAAAPLPPAEAVTRANRLFCEFAIHTHYSTLAFGRAGGNGDVELCIAGHCPVIWLRTGKEDATIASTGLPVGMFVEAEYTAQRVNLAPGDRLVLYTDGVTETRDAADAEYGLARLTEVCRGHAAAAPEELIAACRQDLDRFRGPRRFDDDVTLLVLARQA
jgi:sigma-B regulation protein RsbU (phosphoserine phosphatase)